MKNKKEKKKELSSTTKVVLLITTVFVLFMITMIALFAYAASKFPLEFEINVPEDFLEDTVTESSYDHPLLNEEQEVFFENIGVDTTEIPTEFSEAHIACAVERLGQERVDAIIGGSSPTPLDFLKAASCF